MNMMNMGGSGAGGDGWCNGSTPMNNGFTPGAHDGVCITFLFSTWILNTQVKYAFAVIGTMFMGFAAEALSRYRQTRIAKWERPRWRASMYLLSIAMQFFLMYCLMLIAMTYSTLLFLAVIAGLAAGHMTFAYKPTIQMPNNDVASDSSMGAAVDCKC